MAYSRSFAIQWLNHFASGPPLSMSEINTKDIARTFSNPSILMILKYTKMILLVEIVTQNAKMNNLFSGNHLTRSEKSTSANTIAYSVSSEVSVKGYF